MRFHTPETDNPGAVFRKYRANNHADVGHRGNDAINKRPAGACPRRSSATTTGKHPAGRTHTRGTGDLSTTASRRPNTGR